MSEDSKAVIRKYYELLDKGDAEGIKDLFADNMSWQFPVQPEPPHEGVCLAHGTGVRSGVSRHEAHLTLPNL